MIKNNLLNNFLWIITFSVATFFLSVSYTHAAAIDATVKISVCGNNLAEGGEQCDGSALNGASCPSLGFPSGSLSCTPACEFDTSSCTSGSNPQCSDGIDNDGDGKTDYPGDPGCDSTGDNDEADYPPPTTDYYTQGIAPIIVFPRLALTGATTTYEAEFPANVSIPIGGKIVITYPSGFSFASSCATPVTAIENDDLNGFSQGIVTIASISCNGAARTVSVTTAGVATIAGDRIRFFIQGVANSVQARDYTTAGYVAAIETRNVSDAALESKSSQPFFLAQAGSQVISGTVFDDNGSGLFGFANDGIKNGSEPGASSIRVCLRGAIGVFCFLTDTNGVYSFSNLADGPYHIEIPPLVSGNFIGGPFFRDIALSGGQNETEVNFALRSANRSITVNIFGIPSNTNLDVFSFSPTNPEFGGYNIREAFWDGNSSRTVTIPAFDGLWEIGVGPWMPKDPAMGTNQMPPPVNFIIPQSQQVQVSGARTYSLNFALIAANNIIKGKVTDGSGNAIPNVFINATAPTDSNRGTASSQSLNDGVFELRVRSGIYKLNATMPGMPPSNEVEVTVNNDSGNAVTDGNSAADVYNRSTLITNDGDGGYDNLILKINKGSRSISGAVLDESNSTIPYAHVSAQKLDASNNPLGSWVGSPTDASGNFTLYVADGTWELRGFAPGYGELGALIVTVAGSDQTGKNLQVSAASFGTITGQVTKNGSAVVGAFVTAYGSSGGNMTVTNTNGDYSLKVKAGSGYTIEGFMPGSGPLSQITGVTVTAGATLSDKNLTLSTPGTIRVSISNVGDAFVNAVDSSGRGNGTAANPTTGVYEINVPSGTYTVTAQSPQYGPIGSQSGVAVTGGDTTNFAFSPPSAYTVSGSVQSASSICKNSASVFLSDATNGRKTITTTDSAGSYSLSVPNGNYRLSASKPGCIDNAAPSSLLVNSANVSAGTDRTLVVADAALSGSVTLSGSNISVTTRIIAKNSNGIYVFASVDTSASTGNNYTLNLNAGNWTVWARSDGYISTESTVSVSSGGSGILNIALSSLSGYAIGDSSSSLITPSQGGTIRNTTIGSNFQMQIPAGVFGNSSDSNSVSTRVTSAVVTETTTGKVVGGKGIEITPQNSSGQPITSLSSSSGNGVTVTVPYDESDVTTLGGDESKLILASWSEEKQEWEPLSTTVDTVNNTLTAIATHFSVFAPIVPTGGGAPSTPTGLSANAVSSSQINLSWAQSADATGYDIYRDTSSSGSFPRIGGEPTVSSGDTTAYANTGLSAGTTYYYKIAALNASGESAASNAVSAKTNDASGSSGSSGGGGGGGGGGWGGIGGIFSAPTGVNFSGRAYPKNTVTLLKDAQIAATVVAGTDANFRISVSDLSAGSYVFSIYSEDNKGARSSLLTFPTSVTSGATTYVSGIFIAPTIAVDKSEVKRGDNVAIFGQSVPNGEITVAISSDEEFFGKVTADQNGAYLYNFDTSQLAMGQHFTKSKAAKEGAFSSFGKAVSFIVGTKNIVAELHKTPDKGDMNGDGRVNLVDFSIAAYWHKRISPPASVDLNGDGKVDLIDFSIMAFSWTG